MGIRCRDPAHLSNSYPIDLPGEKFPISNYGSRLKSPELTSSPTEMPDLSDSVSSGSGGSSHTSSPRNTLIQSFTPPTPPSELTSPLSDPSPIRSFSKSPALKEPLSPQEEFLKFVEPSPVSPPRYDTLPPGGCPKFPIVDHEIPSTEPLPDYSPSAYKIGVVSRKLEWLTPYEASPARSWKHVILELNSTQLNLYAIPATLENHLLSFRPTSISPERSFSQEEETDLDLFNSYVTSALDLQLLKYCQRLGLLNNCNDQKSANPDISSPTSELYTNLVGGTNVIPINTKDQAYKSLKSNKQGKKLIRSYSLQHARLGLATDYKKRANVLRLRLESEQILISFPTTRDLIEWNTALNIGKDLALDVNERELPRYRTVPRRRRRNQSAQIDDCFVSVSRSRSQSDPNRYNDTRGLKNRFSKLRNKLSSSPSRNLSVSSSNIKFMAESRRNERSQSVSIRPINESKQQNRAATVCSITNNTLIINGPNQTTSRSHSLPTFTLTDEDDDDNESIIPHTSVTSPCGEEEEEDIQNLSDLHRSDDDDDDDDDDDVDYDGEDEDEGTPYFSSGAEDQGFVTQRRRQDSMRSCFFTSAAEYKWQPSDGNMTQRKFYRNCLRCIKPLTSEDSWVSKPMVKPTTLSPLNLAYLKNMKYFDYYLNNYPNSSNYSNASSSNSLTSLMSENSNFNSLLSGSSSSRKRSASIKDTIFALPDSSLSKLPNHFLKEYTVGSHGLIPKVM